MIIRLHSIILNLLFHFLQFTTYIICRINKPALLIIAGQYFYITINQRFKSYHSHIWQAALTHTRGKMSQISSKKKAVRFYNKQVFRIQALETILLFRLLIRLSVTNLISLMINIRIRVSVEFKVPTIFRPFTVVENKDVIVWFHMNIIQLIRVLKRKVLLNEEVGNLILIPITKATKQNITQQKQLK